MSDDLGLGRTRAITWNESIINKTNQRVRQPFMFHYLCLLSSLRFKTVEKCRTARRGCRNPLNYVERQRKLLVLWRKERNTPKVSNTGSLRPKTASHNGAGKGRNESRPVARPVA